MAPVSRQRRHDDHDHDNYLNPERNLNRDRRNLHPAREKGGVSMKRPGRKVAVAALAFAGIAVLCYGLTAVADEPRPRIVVDPDTIKSGEDVTVHGFDFCGDEGCSAVRIVLEDEAVAEDVEVGPRGGFAVSFAALAPPGFHEVLAVQETGADGEEIEAVFELTIGVGEQKPGPRAPIPR
jgi:hypothetical protein